MEITYTDKLKAHMAKKGHFFIVIDLVDSATSTSGFTDICGRFANEKGIRILEEKGQIVRRYDAPIGELIITARGLEYDEHVELGLRGIAFINDITFKGVRAYSL